MATHSTTTRRAALATMAGVALTAAIPPASAAALPAHAAPTDKGRRLLAGLASLRAVWATRPESDEECDAASDATDVFLREATAIAHELATTPVRTMSDVIDRAIAIGWLAHNDKESWAEMGGVIGSLLAVGGIQPELLAEEAAADAVA